MRQMAAAKAELTLEFPLPWIAEAAVAVGSGTLVADPEWNHTWEANPAQAMTVSPQTGSLFHNPLWCSFDGDGQRREGETGALLGS